MVDNLELAKLICDGLFHGFLFVARWAATICLMLLALMLCVDALGTERWQPFGCIVVLCVLFYFNGRADQHLLE